MLCYRSSRSPAPTVMFPELVDAEIVPTLFESVMVIAPPALIVNVDSVSVAAVRSVIVTPPPAVIDIFSSASASVMVNVPEPDFTIVKSSIVPV